MERENKDKIKQNLRDNERYKKEYVQTPLYEK